MISLIMIIVLIDSHQLNTNNTFSPFFINLLIWSSFLFLSYPSMELHKANLEAQSQAAALLSCQSPYGAANPSNNPTAAAVAAAQANAANMAAAQQVLLLQQQQQQHQAEQQHQHLKSFLIPCSTGTQPSLAYFLKAPLTSSTGTMGDNVQPTTMSSLQVPSAFAPGTPTTSTTPALAGPVMAAGHHQPNHAVASPILYHVTPKLKAAAGGLVTLTSNSVASRANDHKFSPY